MITYRRDMRMVLCDLEASEIPGAATFRGEGDLPKFPASRPRCLNGPAHKFARRSFHQPFEKPVGLVFWPYILVGPLLTH
jgi:hypothetical protein